MSDATYSTELLLAGVDLAWNSDANGTAVARGRLVARTLVVEAIDAGVVGFDRVAACVLGEPAPHGVAIDGSLIIRNATGRRPCEAELTRMYQARHAGCHSSNLRLYPDAHGVRLSNRLGAAGYRHLGMPGAGRFQLEVYPHPALIEIFGLAACLKYKKGHVGDRRGGQAQLAGLLADLEHSAVLRLVIPERLAERFDRDRIGRLRGAALKHNEDALDAVVCLYVCGLYALGVSCRTFGDLESGYIVVPSERCV